GGRATSPRGGRDGPAAMEGRDRGRSDPKEIERQTAEVAGGLALYFLGVAPTRIATLYGR
ncbi:hypothetical protein, partial [Brevundimonas sp.]|uniref:hypothetical protein n=1 Tax=Brevundimonas sp. TaxID=1871086 RepID=UPI003A8D4DDF